VISEQELTGGVGVGFATNSLSRPTVFGLVD